MTLFVSTFLMVSGKIIEMKKLEGLFGLKLGEVLDESKYKIISKELAHG